MAATTSPATSMPFGYSFDQPSRGPYPSPPVPAPGRSLLDDHESTMFGSFLTGVDVGDFRAPSLPVGATYPGGGDEGLFGFSTGLAPTLYGFSADLPQSDISATPMTTSAMMPVFTDQGEPVSEPTPDMLAAANTLLQNDQVSMPRRNISNINSLSFDDTSLSNHIDRSFSNIPHSHITSMNPPPSRLLHRNSVANTVDDPLLRSIMYGNHAPAPQPRRRTVDFSYGSDSSFLPNSYAPPPGQETEEQVTKELMHKMECFERQNSANNTEPSSPQLLMTHTTRRPRPQQALKERRRSMGDDGHQARPRKRRKSKATDDDAKFIHAEKIESPVTSKSTRSRTEKSEAKEKKAEEFDLSPSKRRKSITHSHRENLTEEQKRNNHILSEQKRRNLIKQGFEDLCDIVPALREGTFSKSAMLTEAADWLEELVKSNEELKKDLDTLEKD